MIDCIMIVFRLYHDCLFNFRSFALKTETEHMGVFVCACMHVSTGYVPEI